MAVKTLYFKNVTVNGALSLQDGGTAPTGALTTTGWTVAKLAATNHSIMAVGTKKASGTFAAADALATPTFTAASCWRSENPFNGTFANTNWSLVFRLRCSLASSQTGAVKVRIWKSTNADGTGATQVTSAVLTGTTTAVLSTSASQSSTVTYTPGGTKAFNNEYLWVQCEWSIVATAGSNSADSVFYVESAGAITTPNFINAYVISADEPALPYAYTGKAADLDIGRKLIAAQGNYAITGNDTGVPIVTPWISTNVDLTYTQIIESTATGPHYVSRPYTFIKGDSYQFSIDYKPTGPVPRGIYFITNLAYGPNSSSFSITGSNTGVETASNFTSGYWTFDQHSITTTANTYYKALIRGTYIEPNQVSRTGDLQIYLYSTSNSYTGDGNSGILFQNYKALHYSRFNADYGTYGLTGNDATLTYTVPARNLVLTADSGNYSIVGADAILTYAPSLAKILDAANGGYSYTGNDTNIDYNRRSLEANGVYGLTGRNADLDYNHRLLTWENNEVVQRDGQNIAQSDGQIVVANPATIYGITGKAATLKVGYKVAAANGVYTRTGQNATFYFNHRSLEANGVYGLTGQAATFKLTYRSLEANGVYGLTGRDATLTYVVAVKGVNADFGVYGIAGQIATLRATRKLALANTIYSYTGFAAGLKISRQVNAANGTYTRTGFAATLTAKRSIALANGAYSITGPTTILRAIRKLALANTIYTYTGNALTLRIAHKFAAANAAYTYTGQASTLRFNHQLIAANTSYAISGKVATFKLRYQIAAAQGVYTFAGQTVALTSKGRMDTGTFTLTGNPAILRRSRLFLNANAAYTSTGQAATLRLGRKISAANGSYSIAGQTATFKFNHRVLAANGVYTRTGQVATLRFAHNLVAANGTFSLTGKAINFKISYRLVNPAGNYQFAGQDVRLTQRVEYELAATRGIYNVSGRVVNFRTIRSIDCENGTYSIQGESSLKRHIYIHACAMGPYGFAGQAVTLEAHTGTFAGSYGIVGTPVTFIRTYRHVTSGIIVTKPANTVSSKMVELNTTNAINEPRNSVSSKMSELPNKVSAIKTF